MAKVESNMGANFSTLDPVMLIYRLCRWSIGLTVVLVGVLALIDIVQVGSHLISPVYRLIDGHVLVAMFGAIVIQVGAAVGAIIYLLPKANSSSSPYSVTANPAPPAAAHPPLPPIASNS